ncbi:SDR family NAD(P)-dependent oxidoreductase [Bacillus cereus group sp. N34]|nr:SDR family NAD(P)-dependent oxidoreductase [Bacillus cereus group sp. N34]
MQLIYLVKKERGEKKMEQLLKLIIEGATNGKIDRHMAVEALQMIQSKDSKGNKDIAIIGIAADLPGAEDTTELWGNLVSGVDSVRPFPELRKKDIDRYLSHIKMPEKDLKYTSGAFLESIDKFDYRFFRLSPTEANLMDPNQRLFLKTAWHAIEDAGYAGERITGTNTGVYVGFASTFKDSYQKMISDVDPSSIGISIAANLPAMIPTRISYLLDLKGPTMVIDTACSSGLVSLHTACQGIINGDCEMAIAGAVKIHTIPLENEFFKTGVESSDYKTHTFDDNSDGAGIGEGTIAVILKPLSLAQEDGDQIYAIIKGSAVNQDGASIGITAPNPQAQKEVIMKAWEEANINPETISYIEAHGTGTKLGDPIEIEGLEAAFSQYTNKKQFCAIGSVKPNIGHLYECAGMANLLKATLALKYRELPPTIHMKSPNQNINFIDSPLFINTTYRKWEKTGDTPRRLGINSFGFSGTNCHVVLEESPDYYKEPIKEQVNHYVLTLSTKSEGALSRLIEKYKVYFENKNDQPLKNICYTSNTGRGHYEYRLAIVFSHEQELISVLNQLCKVGVREQQPGVFYGVNRRGKHSSIKGFTNELTEREQIKITAQASDLVTEFLEKGGDSKKTLFEICKNYTRGADIEWVKLYKNMSVKKTSLPLYPFEQNRCWIDIPESTEKEEENMHYVLNWKEKCITSQAIQDSSKVVLLLMRGTKKSIVDLKLIEALRNDGKSVIEVNIGNEFKKLAEDKYIISNTQTDYIQLLNNISKNNIGQIIHLHSQGEEGCISSLQEMQESQRLGVYSLFYLVRALESMKFQQNIELYLIANSVNRIDGREVQLRPELSTLFGLGKVINKEFYNISCRAIDLDQQTDISVIVSEMKVDSNLFLVGYRQGKRYVEEFAPLSLQSAENKEFKLYSNGIYIITGGLGGIGLSLAKWLASMQSIHLVLLGRTELPDKSVWKEVLNKSSLSQKQYQQIKTIIDIELTGTKVSYYSIDITDYYQMEGLLNRLREEYGNIRGIFHAAGIASNELISLRNEKDFSKVMHPKVQGTCVIDRLTANDELDFFVAFSSIATMFPGPGQGDYTAANAFLDAYAAARNSQGKRMLTINWSTWKEVGMAFEEGFNIDTLFKALSTKQALQELHKILTKDINYSNVLIGELNSSSRKVYKEESFQFLLNSKVAKQLCIKDKHYVSKEIRQSPNTKNINEVYLIGREEKNYKDIEKLLAQIWGEFLGFSEVSVYDNYYELGGDSILSVRIINRINQKLAIQLSAADLLKHLTIEELANYIDSLEIVDSQDNFIIPKAPLKEYYQLSSAQKRIFITEKMAKNNLSYNTPRFLFIEGPLDHKQFEKTFQGIALRHESLRTSFKMSEKGPVQRIHKNVTINMGYCEAEESEVDTIIENFIQPFDLKVAPLLRVNLIKLAPERFLLLFDMHHIITDGVAMDNLICEIMQLYEGHKLPPLKRDYKDYSEWQNKMLGSKNMNHLMSYWQEILSGDLPEVTLPIDFPRPAIKTYSGNLYRFVIDEKITESLRELSIKTDMTLYMILLAAYNVLIAKVSNQQDILIGSPIMGRPHVDFEEIIGVFINTLVLRNRPEEHKTFLEFLGEVKTNTLNAYKHQDIPFELLADKFGGQRKPNRNPLFDVVFNFHNESNHKLELSNLQVIPYEKDSGISKFDLTLEMFVENDKINSSFEYSNEIFEIETIKRITDDFVCLLTALVKQPNVAIGEIELESSSKVSHRSGKEIEVEFNF